MSIERLAIGMSLAGYAVGPVRIDVDDRGKKKPTFPDGAWTLSTDPADYVEATGAFIDTGKSGIVVIDLDSHGDVDGRAALAAAGIQVPETPMVVTTQSGGTHLYFRQPEDPIGSHQGVPAPGVDIRGLGGIVFSPETQVHGGGVYGRPARSLRVDQLPVLPAEFAQAIRAATAKPPRAESTLTPYTGTLTASQQATIEGWYDDDIEEIRQLQDGQRHSGLLRLVSRALARGNQLGLRMEDTVLTITEAYEASGGTDDADLREVLRSAIDWAETTDLPVPLDWVDPDDARFEEAVKEKLTKLRINVAAQKLLAQDDDDEEIDLGRPLDFHESPGSLFGQAWVQDVIPKGETTIMYAERNNFKSFVAIDLALCVAEGRPWHGKKVDKGRALFLAGEGGVGLPARRRSWVQHHRTVNPDGLDLRDRIVRLANPKSVAAWQQVIRDGEYDLVVIDTLRRASRGSEMESPGEMQELIETLDDLRGVREGCSVLALHHPTKSQPDTPAGAGTLLDAVPVVHRLVKTGEGPTTEVAMTTIKNKDGVTGPLLDFGVKAVGDSIVLVPVAGGRCGRFGS